MRLSTPTRTHAHEFTERGVGGRHRARRDATLWATLRATCAVAFGDGTHDRSTERLTRRARRD